MNNTIDYADQEISNNIDKSRGFSYIDGIFDCTLMKENKFTISKLVSCGMAHGQTNHTTDHQVINNSASSHQPLDLNCEHGEPTFIFVSNATPLDKSNQQCLLQNNGALYVQENGVPDRPNELAQGQVSDLMQKYEQEADAQSSISSSSSTTGLIIDEQEEGI
ncbi:unnamed protein product [Rotaria socialis]|uniref:Uncharacterized protein n=2 Tax=Rotaria socialis TaxID=392032 RepID=A0A818QFL6_9BILA|nr:unnamed protein product [Rotaria socialis]